METERVGVRGDRCSCEIGGLTVDETRFGNFRMPCLHAENELIDRERRPYDFLTPGSFVVKKCLELSL